ncbi:hypothetical protein BPLS_P0564 [Bathymodiolus platifrons methanotrophic gill symbiont]|uniref:OmpA family protein n=1 Tax=Bathymodiolus platifrons methanotrophic gill symbiont TaxID=113268 RepID=UPI0011CC0BD7|nr:OmpA family protein [Bathymodiolus platifrons methanotrophic gill symbiont]TXK99689.1 hypothetical protein BMR02_07325 [Methylococcaceae bacterium HT1]GFO74113.1 hypothetical protein BPLS_P0564 [Bathymodiolus platifrons methanotrophic gill symbiont]
MLKCFITAEISQYVGNRRLLLFQFIPLRIENYETIYICFCPWFFNEWMSDFFRSNPKMDDSSRRSGIWFFSWFCRKQYLIEQHALLRSKVLDKGVESEIKGDTLTVNIPGNIAFSPNSARMNWNVHEILDRISPILKEYKYTSILVFGLSDSKGDRDVNQLLSEQRARVIREYFINSGVNILRITSRGLGGDDPLISDELTTLERSLNRRITLEIKIDEALVEKDSRDKGK